MGKQNVHIIMPSATVEELDRVVRAKSAEPVAWTRAAVIRQAVDAYLEGRRERERLAGEAVAP